MTREELEIQRMALACAKGWKQVVVIHELLSEEGMVTRRLPGGGWYPVYVYGSVGLKDEPWDNLSGRLYSTGFTFDDRPGGRKSIRYVGLDIIG